MKASKRKRRFLVYKKVVEKLIDINKNSIKYSDKTISSTIKEYNTLHKKIQEDEQKSS